MQVLAELANGNNSFDFYATGEFISLSTVINLDVNALQGKHPSKTIQYANDTTVYASCKPTKLHEAERKNSSFEYLEKWANDHSLAINAVKLKDMICVSKRTTETSLTKNMFHCY